MTCPLCHHDERRERCNWPMPESPASFGAGDDLDREFLALRLPAPTFDATTVAELLGMPQSYVWTMVKRGKLPEPDHYERTEANGDKAVWKAEQLVELV